MFNSNLKFNIKPTISFQDTRESLEMPGKFGHTKRK